MGSTSPGGERWHGMRASLAILRGKRGVLLERFVRFVASVIEIFSVTLAITASPYFAMIAELMETGLAGARIGDQSLDRLATCSNAKEPSRWR